MLYLLLEDFRAGEMVISMRIAVIGGGASGMMAAITAARAGARVVLFEKNDRMGKKILVTGNGKCNLSNLSFSDSCFHSKEKEKAWKIASRFTPRDTISFFEGLGLMMKDKNGYLYPACEQASAVLDVLRYEVQARGIEVRYGAAVEQIQPLGEKGFALTVNGHAERFERVIVACGGQASPKTGSDGSGYRLMKALNIKMVRPVPALVQLRCQEKGFQALAGIRCDAVLTLLIDGQEAARERGELQMTDYGISGIPVFQFSRYAAYALEKGCRIQVCIDLLPELFAEQIPDWLKQRMERLKGRSAEEFLTGTIHKKWILYFLKEMGIKPNEEADNIPLSRWIALIERFKSFTVTVTDTNSFQNAQVCAGGVSLRQVDENLESTQYKGLFLAGELLDVDGRCGGYNLQWAWCSGYLAGTYAARERKKDSV